MKFRRNAFASAAVVPTLIAAALVVGLVAVIGAAQAAPQTKLYSAKVQVSAGQVDTVAGTATLTLILKNESKNTLGSADFDPEDSSVIPTDPSGNPAPAGTTFATSRPGDWSATWADGVIKFRSTSSTVALKKDELVSADVPVEFSGCTNALWNTRAKQSNDFSGNPGNDFQLESLLSNLVPLGSFVFDQIGTHKGGFLVPQIVVNVTTIDPPVTLTAYDICGEKKTGYGSGTAGNSGDLAILSRDESQVPARLDKATITGPSWVSGIGTATLKATVVETGDRLVATDDVTGISANSDAGDDLDEFDVVKELCTNATLGTTCQLDSPGGAHIHVQAPKPPAPADGGDAPSLGFGFNPDLGENFNQCNGADGTLGDLFVNINPRDYPGTDTVKVTLTFAKSIIGNGPASSHVLCLSKTNGADWAYANPVPSCETDTPGFGDSPCIIEQKKTNGGDLLVVLSIKANDPWGGMT